MTYTSGGFVTAQDSLPLGESGVEWWASHSEGSNPMAGLGREPSGVATAKEEWSEGSPTSANSLWSKGLLRDKILLERKGLLTSRSREIKEQLPKCWEKAVGFCRQEGTRHPEASEVGRPGPKGSQEELCMPEPSRQATPEKIWCSG